MEGTVLETNVPVLETGSTTRGENSDGGGDRKLVAGNIAAKVFLDKEVVQSPFDLTPPEGEGTRQPHIILGDC